MTVTVTRRRAGAWAIVGVAVVAVLVVTFWPRQSTAARDAQNLRSALHPVDVLYADGQLRRAADRGASSARLLVLTNQLLDLVGDDSQAERRRAIDGALASLSGAGCPVCETALERARP